MSFQYLPTLPRQIALRFMEKYPTGVITKKQFSDEMGVSLKYIYDDLNDDDHYLDEGGHLVRLRVQHV